MISQIHHCLQPTEAFSFKLVKKGKPAQKLRYSVRKNAKTDLHCAAQDAKLLMKSYVYTVRQLNQQGKFSLT